MALGHAPLHRSARTGAVLLVLGALEFVVVMIVTQLYYSSSYSLSTNYISDLGNTSHSPLWYLFSAGIIALGVLSILGILLLWNTFPAGGLRVTGLALLLVASACAIVIGFFPENINGGVHSAASLGVFLLAGLGLIAIGGTMRESTGWESMRWVSIGLGAVTLVSLGLFLFTNVGSSQYPGLFERLVVAPVLLWAIVVGLYLSRFPVRARGRAHLLVGAKPL
jgi:hypothetical membrane protein